MDVRTAAPGQGSPSKQRRGSLPASPALNALSGWAFRDEMGLPSSGLPNPPFMHERSQSAGGISALRSSEEPSLKRTRKKWTQEETQLLVDGCNAHGVGNWKAILNDPALAFEPGRTPVDLKDRFRTYFPDAYRQHYPNAKTHLSDKIRSTLPNGGSLFEKTRTKRRRPFSAEEDDALRRGYEKHGTLWVQIAQDPIFQAQQRRSTDLRDRFRNAFPDLYEAAGYKPRTPSRKSASSSQSARTVDGSAPQEHARSRAMRRRLTYPGMIQRGTATPASDSVDYSSADEEAHQGSEPSHRTHASTSQLQPVRDMEMLLPSLEAPLRDEAQCARRRSTSPLPDHDAVSLSSQSHLLSGPASPSSPRHSQTLPDTGLRDHDGPKATWNGLEWLSPDGRPRHAHAQLTASSLFSANMFGSFSSPHHDVLDRYDLYSSPLSSTANTFGDYVSDMGFGGSFSEADMDLNAFAGPASSMGFTHHSQVAGDLIFASHHGGHLQHGHGFGLYDPNRAYPNALPTPASSSQQANDSLGLTNISFADTGSTESHTPFDPQSLDSLLNSDDVSLALLGHSHDMVQTPDVFPANFTVAPSDLTRHDPLTALSPPPPPSSQPPTRYQQPPLPTPTLMAAPAPLPGTAVSSSLSLPPGFTRRSSPHAHLRSASQPPTEQRLADGRRNLFSLGTHQPTSTRDDSMQDLWSRGPDPYPLPFLDLHYYGVGEAHSATSSAARDPNPAH